MSKGIEMLVQNGRFAFYMLKFPKYLHAGGRATASVKGMAIISFYLLLIVMMRNSSHIKSIEQVAIKVNCWISIGEYSHVNTVVWL